MKIQCDVCNKTEASVYCSADEAALCSTCDHRVHHANKLAGKHPRYSLHHPPPQDSPVMCDICQDKKALLFCQQDRAILCKDCDVAIHKVNHLTQNHHRFLLTGVKLSPTASFYCSSASPASLPVIKSGDRLQKLPVVSSVMNQTNCHQEINGSGHGSTGNSISEYLIEMLPGWHVDDFLDPSNFSKKLQEAENDPGLIWGGDLIDGSMNSSFSAESMGMWVPQAPPPARYGDTVQQIEPSMTYMRFGDQTINGSTLVFGQGDCYNLNNFNENMNGAKPSRNRIPDNGNCFMVPQISPQSTTAKRSRTLWQ